MRSIMIAAALAALVCQPARVAAQTTLSDMQQKLSRGVSTVSVAIISDGGAIVTRGGLSEESVQAALELEFRKAGIRVVPHASRGDDGALLMAQIVCYQSTPACAMTVELSRYAYFGEDRQRIAGEIWSSGPIALSELEWPLVYQRMRQVLVDRATIVANLIVSSQSAK